MRLVITPHFCRTKRKLEEKKLREGARTLQQGVEYLYVHPYPSLVIPIPSGGYMLSHETQKQLHQSGTTEAEFIAALRTIFPHGHEDYLPIAIKELELHSTKNHDYAKGGTPLGNFDRVSKILALYPGLDPADRRVVALTYALKQLDAVLWGMAKRIVHKVEGLNDRLQDITVYAKIVMCMNTEDARNAEIDKQFGVDLVGQDKVPAGYHPAEFESPRCSAHGEDRLKSKTEISANEIKARDPYEPMPIRRSTDPSRW